MIEKTKIVIDSKTGEILQNESQVIKKVKQDEFIQVYLEDLSGLLSLNSKSEIQILCMLWKYSEYLDENELGNKVTLNTWLKDKIKEEIGLAESTIKNSITSFCKRKLLIKDGKYKGIYYLNATYFFKGKLSDRATCFRKTIEYSFLK